MPKHNANNERIKRNYFIYLKEAMRQSEPSIDSVAKALKRFEDYTQFCDFKSFNVEQAIGFKKQLSNTKGQQSGKPLSKATLNSTLQYLKKFFHWLAGQPGYKSRLNYSDCEYFNISDKDRRISTASRERPVPTLEQIKHVIESMPCETDIEKRNRALIAFTLLTGARDGAIASFKLKHVNLVKGSIFQDARDVMTKYSKTFETFFFPVGDDILQIFHEWVTYLKTEKLWGSDDPLFPATLVKTGETRQFEAVGLDCKHWGNASPIRKIFTDAFIHAGLPYFHPHSFRKTLVRLGEEICRTPEEFKAWSQNLGHEQVLTTFTSYGSVSSHRQGELLQKLASNDSKQSKHLQMLAQAVAQELSSHKY